MDAKVSQRFQLLTCMYSKKVAPKPSNLLLVSRRTGEKKLQIFVSPLNKEKNVFSGVSCSYKSNPENITSCIDVNGFLNISSATAINETGCLCPPSDEALILKNKSEAIVPHLNGRCIYLVGMMGSGKTTVGKILSQVLRYSFCDCDAFVEEEVGTSVADIFKLYGEGVFRDKESEALMKLSLMHHLVVSTGGGAVIRPINLKYMQKGISVWLDVPLEALAHRIVAVGTGSRPLLHHDSGDAYAKALLRLSYLFEERRDAYARTDAKVSLENIAAKLGCRDVLTVSPAAIALEALEQIGGFLKREDGCFSG